MCVCILLQVRPLQWPLSLNWRQGKDLPIDVLVFASSVVINGAVYCGGNDPNSHDVIQLTPENGDWSELPRSPVPGFAMTSLNGQLVVMIESECGTVAIVSGSIHTLPCLLDEGCQLLWDTRNIS